MLDQEAGLVTDETGRVHEIIPKKDAGENVEEYRD